MIFFESDLTNDNIGLQNVKMANKEDDWSMMGIFDDGVFKSTQFDKFKSSFNFEWEDIKGLPNIKNFGIYRQPDGG